MTKTSPVNIGVIGTGNISGIYLESGPDLRDFEDHGRC